MCFGHALLSRLFCSMKQSWDKEKERRTNRELLNSVYKGKHRCLLHPPHSAFFPLLLLFTGGSFTTCFQRKLSPFYSACQTESSEDKERFLAWNALWNVFENKVINDNCHQRLALSNAFFIVFRPKRTCCILKFQMVGWLCDRQASIFKYVQAHMKVHLCISLPIYKLYPHILFP